MSSVDKAFETQLNNIQKRTGKTLDRAVSTSSGRAAWPSTAKSLPCSSETWAWGTAMPIRSPSSSKSAGEGKEVTADDAVNEIYSGAKAALRPIHEELMAAIVQMGPFEIAPKKGYVSLRRKRQFAMIGPATRTRVEVGLNMKGVESHGAIGRDAAGRHVPVQGERHGRQGGRRGADRAGSGGLTRVRDRRVAVIHNIAHRGASACEPENTLRAFERAIEMGATMMELDAHLQPRRPAGRHPRSRSIADGPRHGPGRRADA